CGIEHVCNSPKANTDSVIPPGVINDIGDPITRIRGNCGTCRRVKLPNLDIGNDPYRERFSARPGKRLSFKDQRIVISLGSSYGTASSLLRRQQTCSADQTAASSEEIASV